MTADDGCGRERDERAGATEIGARAEMSADPIQTCVLEQRASAKLRRIHECEK
jgi:hypothetical protein